MKWAFALLMVLLSAHSRGKERGFTLSGGVSLGSYEAGLFYSLIEQDKNNLAAETKVVFGTSAGSINGLLGIFDICGFRKTSRETSLLWKMWIPVGLNQLEATDKKVQSLLDRKATEGLFKELRERWKEGFQESCDVHFGVAVARNDPFVDELKPGLEVVRQSEFFTVRIKGRGPGKYPLVENQKYAGTKQYRSYLPVGESPEKDVNILLDLVQASSAFPGAFTPYPISFCYSRPGEQAKDCNSENAKTSLFIDGGIYHNGPVGFAYEAMLRISSDKDFKVYYINASSPLESQKQSKQKETKEAQDVFKEFHKLFTNVVTQARKFELAKSLETYPDIVKHLESKQKNYPLASEPLYAFTGFLEKDFRKSDFYLGMYDAGGVPQLDQEFECFQNKINVSGSQCTIDENLQILINLAKYRKENRYYEGDFDINYGFLEKNHFEFKDLGLKRNESRYGRVYTKERLTVLLKDYAGRQPMEEQQKLKYFIRPSLNYLQYTPLKDFWYAAYASSPEVCYSKIIPERHLESSSFRFDVATMINGFSNFFSRAQDVWAITPLVGVEYEPLWLNTAVWQWRAGIRGGYVLSPQDDLGRGTCDAELAETYSGACSGATIHMVGAMSLFERLRLQLIYVPFVVNSTSIDKKPELLLQLGFQFGESF